MSRFIARALVWLAARLTPPTDRSRFLREWRSELSHESAGLPAAAIVRSAAGAFPDALTLRRLARTPSVPSAWSTSVRIWADDVRIVVRGLLRAPTFSIITVMTLALGLGGAAAIYTMLDRIVLDPLPFADPDGLVYLDNDVPGVGPNTVWGASTAQFVHYTDRSQTLAEVGLYRAYGGNLQTPTGAQRADGWRATASLFRLLGARTVVGRPILDADDQPGAPPVVLLSHALWQREFGGDPTVVGSAIQLSGRPVEVVGVLEPGFEAPVSPASRASDVWMPLQIDRSATFSNNHVFQMVGRLQRAAEPADVSAELARLRRELPEAFPRAYSERFFEGTGFTTRARPLQQVVVGDLARNLWILFASVSIVLLVACANVANLFAVRGETRVRELAIRTALGASRAALTRYVLIESLLLSTTGGVLALAVGWIAGPWLLQLAPASLPRIESVAFGADTVAFVVGLATLLGTVLAAYALVRQPEIDASQLGGTRTAGTDRARGRIRNALVAGQVALALTLAVGAGLLVQSIRRLNAIAPGFDPGGVVTAQIYLTPARYGDDTEIWSAYARILDGVRALPGVTAAGMSEELPVEGGFGCTVQGFEDQVVYDRLRERGLNTCAGQERTTPGYFEAMGIPLVAGRPLTRADHTDPTRGAVVVSETFARRFWPGESAIGKGVAPSGRTDPPFYRVVGVVGDVPAESLDGEPANAVYYPIVHHPDTPARWGWWRPDAMYLVVRTALDDPSGLVGAIRDAIVAVDPTIPMVRIRPMEEVVSESTARFAFVSVLLGIAAAMSMALAAVGLYGVVSYVVSRSTREIGVRVAVGARPAVVQRLFMVRSLGLIAVGVVVGTGLALATTGVLRGMLYGVTPTDPLTYAMAAAGLGAVALLASWVPARRASRVDPMRVLRSE